MKLIDNIHTTLAEDLRTTLTSGSRLSIPASCFSIYAYQELRKEPTQKVITKKCAEWIHRKVRFKSNSTKENMMGFGVVDIWSRHERFVERT